MYFLEFGVGALVSTMANGDAAEVGTIGNEGIVGLPPRVGERQGAHQRLRPGSRSRPKINSTSFSTRSRSRPRAIIFIPYTSDVAAGC